MIGIDAVPMRRQAVLAAGADGVLDPGEGDLKTQLAQLLGTRGAEVVVDATGVPDAIPSAMALACDAGQVVVVGSPRGKANNVNFYDDLHRRYIEVTGRMATCSSSRLTPVFPGPGTSTRPSAWPLGALASGRLSLAGLITHHIAPEGLQDAYEGLLKKKDEYLGVVIHWK